MICNLTSAFAAAVDRCLLGSLIGRRRLVVQVSMWSLQKKPEFKQKFPELIDESQQPEVSLCYASNMLYRGHVMIQDTTLTPVLSDLLLADNYSSLVFQL